MKRFLSAVLVTICAFSFGALSQAGDDKAANAILDKAIKAMGGEGKLATIKAAAWKAKGKISFADNDNPFTTESTVQGLDQYRQEFEAEFMGNKFKALLVLNGDKGWRSFADMTTEMDKDAVATEKRNHYLLMTPITLLPLKNKGFKLQTAGEDKVDGKAAVGLKVTGPDGKDFTLFFDKESGLPVKQVASVVGFAGDEATEEKTYSNYKDFDGIKKATKIVTLRGGQKFMEQEITEFKVLPKVDAGTFSEPK